MVHIAFMHAFHFGQRAGKDRTVTPFARITVNWISILKLYLGSLSIFFWTYSGLLLTPAMMGRTSFHRRVFTACLVTFTGIFMQCSCSCDPLAEPTDLKAYRSAIVVEATLAGTTAYVEKKTMKGQFPSKVSDIQLRGFASEDPCTGPASSFLSNTTYLLFINETSDEGVYKLMGNPEVSGRTGKRTVRKVVKDGGPPVMTKRLKPKSMGEGDRLLLTCAGKGTPLPLMYWERDGRRLEDNDLPRLKIKPSKRNVKLSIRNLDKSLHEGTYTCVLTNKVDPPVIASSTLSICAIQCMHGERHPRKCRCVCDEGYSGDLCQIPDPTTPPPPTTPTPCDLDCGTNGTLDDNLCLCNCNPGFEGETCSDILPTGRTPQPISPDNCTLDCGDHGNRVRGSCVCSCDAGYSGSNCENDDLASCLDGTYCFNGGTCETLSNTDGQSGSRPTPICQCPYGFSGERCEIEVRCPDLDCGPNGNLSPDDCTCICQDMYSGPTCSVLSDNHTTACSEKYKDYCLNGGTCLQLVGINKPTCNCPDLYRGSSRCQYINNNAVISKAPPVVHPSIEQNSMKVIITLTVIFISLLLVLLLVVFIYIKNKNYQEERRKRVKTTRNPLRPPSYNLHPLHQNTNNQAGITSTDIQELEMEPRRPSAPPTVMRVESEGGIHTSPTQRSHSVDVRYSSVPVQANPVVARTMHNGSARKISQASIHSNRSASSHRSTGSSPVSGKRRKLGYEAVPVNEPGDRIEEYRGDAAACEDASIIMLPKEDVCSDGESVCSSQQDDTVDVPNPQVSAIETHLAQPNEDFDDNLDRDFSADVVNANVHFSNPYAHDDSPSLSRGHVTSNMSPRDVNLHENPFHAGLSLQAKPHQPTNKLFSNDGYYGNRYEDEIDRSSPPHAV